MDALTCVYTQYAVEYCYNELVAEGDGFEEDIDEYTSEGIFFVPPEARWSEIAKAAHTPEIGTLIDNAMRSIEKENKRLKDILPKNFARPELDKRRLGDVVDLFTNIQMIEQGSEKDILGRTYEYCLSMFAEQEGKRGGQFYTPSCVVRTLVEVLQPFNGRVYDPCCGSGGMFVQSAKFVENHSGNINNIAIYGQESNPTTWKMAQMNLAIRGIEPDLGSYAADSFLDDRHPTMTESQAVTLFRKAISKAIEPEYEELCFNAIKSDMVIDWYKKESVLSKIRLDLTKALETTPQYTRETAKAKSHQVITSFVDDIS